MRKSLKPPSWSGKQAGCARVWCTDDHLSSSKFCELFNFCEYTSIANIRHFHGVLTFQRHPVCYILQLELAPQLVALICICEYLLAHMCMHTPHEYYSTGRRSKQLKADITAKKEP